MELTILKNKTKNKQKKTHSLSKLTQEEIESLNSTRVIKETGSVINILECWLRIKGCGMSSVRKS